MIDGARILITTNSGAVYLGNIKTLNGSHVAVDTGSGTYIVAWPIIIEVEVL